MVFLRYVTQYIFLNRFEFFSRAVRYFGVHTNKPYQIEQTIYMAENKFFSYVK